MGPGVSPFRSHKSPPDDIRPRKITLCITNPAHCVLATLMLVLGLVACAADVLDSFAPVSADEIGRLKTAIAEQAPAIPQAVETPMVLVHGMAGFKPVARTVHYFYRVRHALTAAGFASFATQTDPFQSVQYRAQQLAVQVDTILKTTGAARVHLVAHSQGGLDARYLISSLGYGDRVASLTTIGTPHHGVRLVDMALRMRPNWVARIAEIINALSDGLLGGKADLVAQLHDVTQQYVDTVFNPANADDSRVAYFSYSGLTQSNPFRNPRTTDIVHPLLMGVHRLVSRVEGDNDGIVGVESARWGTYLGAAAADHWDEIGQPPAGPHLAFDHLGFYVDLARFVAAQAPPPLL